MTFIVGDCITEMGRFPDGHFDLILADPPYGGVVKNKWDKIDDYREFTEKWLGEARRILSDSGSIYVWCSIGPNSTSLLDIASYLKAHFHFQDMIVWKKQRGRGCRRGWMFAREEILWATKGEKYHWNKVYSTEKYHESWIKRLKKEENPYKLASNVWTDINEVTIDMAIESGGRGARKSYHVAQKPVAALERIISAHMLPEGTRVLDPFAGSSSTGVACRNLNVDFVLIDIDPEMERVYLERIRQ